MKKPFIYGAIVSGDNFTDRVKETKRLKLNFENGMNTIIISPRRMGKTSLVEKVRSEFSNDSIKIVYMDIYDCRSEYDFLNRFASTILKATAGSMDRALSTVKEFLTRVTPTIRYSLDPLQEFSLSLGITPENYQPEDILNLPETIAVKKNIHIVVCIDEFQQIGEFTDSLNVQKRMRGMWQHQKNTTYCMFGSKKHLMTNLFQNSRMPFYKFGEMMFLDKIPDEDWIEYICARFEQGGKKISQDFAKRICQTVRGFSSYVQELAWNVYADTNEEVTEENFNNGCSELLKQNSTLFLTKIEKLTAPQMNFLKAMSYGNYSNFCSKNILSQYNLGSKSNIARIKKALIENELIEAEGDKVKFADPVFELWMKFHL